MNMEEAKEKLEALRNSMKKPKLPKYIEKLNPFKDGREIAYFKRINKNVKASFKKNQSPDVQLKLQVENPPTDANAGNLWHTSLDKCIKNPEESKNEIGKAVIDAVDGWRQGHLKLLQSEFILHGYMKYKEENDGDSEIYFWRGRADAIGWYNNKYVIVEWKVVHNLKFWEKDRRAYGLFLHQCLVYARLLKLHLNLSKLPYILIVPICRNETGTDIIPALFSDIPKKCEDEIENYEWLKEFKPATLSLPSGMFNDVDEIRSKDGRVYKDKKLRDVLKDGYTVKQFLNKHKLNENCIVKQLLETLVPGSLDYTIEQLLYGSKYDEIRLCES